MQAYSMDLRERALLDSDAGMKAADVAVKYRVSGSWVRLLKQRRRETGEVAPRVQRHGRRRMLEPVRSRIRHQAAAGSWTMPRQWEIQRTWLNSARAAVRSPAKPNGV